MHLKKIVFLGLVISAFLGGSALATTQQSKDVKNAKVIDLNKKCITCHLKENKSLVFQWENSAHAAAREGQVGCYNCHAAAPGDELGYEHEGAFIKTIMTPTDCAYCHEREVKEMTNSHHATAGQILASLDNLLGEVVCSFPESKADAVNGCWQCHGSIIKVMKDEKGNPLKNEAKAVMLDPKTWPNTGIGRINPDGTKGVCIACHSKHIMLSSTARQPDNCGKCHLGPDHPQIEIYNESKHGIAYRSASRGPGSNGMDIMKQGPWILGKDYYAAPTCSTCHMGGYIKVNGSVEQNTHNVGDRISWNLRAPISMHLNRVTFIDGTVADVPGDIPPRPGQKASYKTYVLKDGKLKKIKAEKVVKSVMSWKDRRKKMQEVCKSCHSRQQIENFYKQFDSLVITYNEKFAKPAKKLWVEMVKDKMVPKSLFLSEAGWLWWEIWHHEGRRARHGASMMGPDYTHWHGMYEIAHKFYFKYLPEIMKLAAEHGKTAKYQKLINDLLSKPEHKWRIEGFGAETQKLIEEERKERYAQ